MSNLLDEAARNDELSYAFDKGEALGLEKGEALLKKGLELDKIAVIQGMLAKNFDWQTIEDITHLNESAYQALKSKHQK